MHEFSEADAVRDLERRWGLTLVSFVPGGAVAPVLGVQARVRRVLARHLGGRPDEPLAEFYDPGQLHCTHLTLTRSTAWGPVRVDDFVRPGGDPEALCDILAAETGGLGPITVTLDRLAVSGNGFQLTGPCADGESAARRSTLLGRLNQRLPEHFRLGRRPWDTDPARHRSVHMRLGFFKRPWDGFRRLAEALEGTAIEPVTLSFADVTVVHHRYRSLRAPHAGWLRFPLDGPSPGGRSFQDLRLRP